MTAKTDFDPFPVGQLFNDLPAMDYANPEPVHEAVEVRYPSRLHAMSLNSSQIVDNNNGVYTPGHINFSVDVPRIVTVRPRDDQSIEISDRTQRQPLVRHAALIMRQALGLQEGLEIDVLDEVSLWHCGLGSSSATISSVAASINELYGKPLEPLTISRFSAQNHGEEIDGSDSSLMPVQCLGGSALCGHLQGGLIIAAGQAVPIVRHDLDPDLHAVFGVPEDYIPGDAKSLLEAELANADGFRRTGQTYGAAIAYRLIHEVLPGLVEGNLKPCKDLIFDYRWDMGSIANCSFAYPRVVEIAEDLRPLKDDEAVEVLSLSSAGPGFFGLTKHPDHVKEKFVQLGLRVHDVRVHNGPYQVNFG